MPPSGMTSQDLETIFKSAKAGWFRARTLHEHGVIARSVRPLLKLDNIRILDFGCGEVPLAAASFALRYPKSQVYGTDIVQPSWQRVNDALRTEASLSSPDNLVLRATPPSTLPPDIGPFDLIYSWSVFEHIPAAAIRDCFSLVRKKLHKDGLFYFQIGGLYFSPDGPHLSQYLKRPWDHLTLSISELHELVLGDTSRSPHSNQSAWRQFVELNRLTSDDFVAAAKEAGLTLVWSETLNDAREPPEALLKVYHHNALKTMEIRALFRP